MHSQKKGLEQMIAPQHDNISITETINYLSQGDTKYNMANIINIVLNLYDDRW